MTTRKLMIAALLVGLALPVWAEAPAVTAPDAVSVRRPMLSQEQREKVRAMTPVQRQEYRHTLRQEHRARMRSECLNARAKGQPGMRHAPGVGRWGGHVPAVGN